MDYSEAERKMGISVDIGIVGAGPIGGYIAANLADYVDTIAIFEQHKEVGKPVNCAGLITPRVFEEFSILTKNIVQNEIKGAHIHSPSGNTLTIGGNKTHAYSIDRTAFDQYLISSAEKKNVSLFLHEKVISAQTQYKTIELQTSKNNIIESSCLIGADGPYSKIRDVFGLPQPKEFLRGIGAIVSNVELDPNYVEVFVGNNIAPGFFAWMIPIDKDGTKARIGLCVSKNHDKSPNIYFNRLFKSQPTAPFLQDAKIKQKMGGIIPLGPLNQTVTDNVLVVGDAAAQVKPTSGGGIYPGLQSAKYCVSTIKEAYKKQSYTHQDLLPYHEAWKKDIGRELNLGMQFRRIYTKFTDKQFDKYIQKFNQETIIQTISEHGDIDYPSKLVKPLIKKAPSLLTLLPQIIR